MDKSCLHLRTRLELEQRRILNFAEAAGILDFQEKDPVPLILQKERLVLIAVFNQIESKLATLAEFTEQYAQFQYDHLESSQVIPETVDPKVRFSDLITWEKAAQRRAENKAARNWRTKGTNHLVKYYHIGTDIVKNPRRIRWTAIHEKAFQSVLSELGGYNDFLEKLLHGEYARRLEERTEKTYLEIVNVRNDVDDLRRLMHNVFHLIAKPENGAHDGDTKSLASDNPLGVLAETKLRSVLNEASDQHRPPAYHDVIKPTKLSFAAIDSISEVPSEFEVSMTRKRSTAKLKSSDQSIDAVDVFIEWKTYSTVLDKDTNRDVPSVSSLDRANGLVALLQSSNLKAFRTPQCEGFFDLRDGENTADRPPLFGVMYKSPSPDFLFQVPTTLESRLRSEAKPPLGARMRLAHAISDSVLYLNTVRWFHKSLRSDAVIFFPESADNVDITKPYLSGFEYARPSSAGRTTHVSQPPANNLYVHPGYQQSTSPGYTRTYDVYSLGIVLLEIAYWDSIKSILSAEFQDREIGPNALEARAVRSILLGETPSKGAYLADVKGIAGERYHKAVQGCIRGFIEPTENEKDITVSMKLQDSFVRDVVDNLRALLDI